MMDLDVQRHGNTAVIEVVGDITFGPGERKLSEEVQRLVSEGVTCVDVCVGRVTYVDSSGLGSLIRSQTSCGRVGGRLRLRGVGSQLRNLLVIARLDDVVEIVDDDADQTTGEGRPAE